MCGTCLRGMIWTCVGACGLMSRNAIDVIALVDDVRRDLAGDDRQKMQSLTASSLL